MYHERKKADIEIRIDLNGDLAENGISKYEKDDIEIILVPVTEKSQKRTSDIAPHPLCDQLQYIAGDLGEYCSGKGNKFDAYIKHLKEWAESDFSCPKVQAVFSYLEKKSVIHDLINAGVFESGDIESSKKLFVRFRVIDGSPKTGTWEDPDLIDRYIHYSASKSKEKELSYVSMTEEPRMKKHPPLIDTAKLIWAPDEDKDENLLYQGRFSKPEQARSIGAFSSHKIHATLKWLSENNSVEVGAVGQKPGRIFLCWSPSLENKEDDVSMEMLSSLFGVQETFQDKKPDIKSKEILEKALKKARVVYSENDKIVVMSVEAPSKGRLSITYYNEQPAHSFFDRIKKWADTFHWFYWQKNPTEDGYSYQDLTPAMWKIIHDSYGIERKEANEKDNPRIKADDRIVPEQYQRLVKCMLDLQPFPQDMMRLIVQKASNLQNYTSFYNKEDVLSTACAVINKYKFDRKLIKEDSLIMELDPKNSDRSYLFGRLLAIFEKVERMTYEKGENREPNAIRLQSAYVNHPMQTWKILETQLIPYYQKLYPGARENFKKAISEITALFREEDKNFMNSSLDENYLLGYYLQRMDLRKKSDDEKNQNENQDQGKDD